MATATQLQTTTPTLTITPQLPTVDTNTNQIDNDPLMEQAISYATLARQALNTLNHHLPHLSHSIPYTAAQILALPLSTHRISDDLYGLPRRGSSRHDLACLIAPLLSPCEADSLTALIRYEEDKVRLRGWAALQRKYDRFVATKRNGREIEGVQGGVPRGMHSPVWTTRILTQGVWDPKVKDISLEGVKAVPMPVTIAEGKELAPFLGHLDRGGTWQLEDEDEGVELGEPYYGTKGAEWKKGVLYEDGRMDLCKMVVGPDHIWNLMRSLKENTFVKHFLLGNNIIGPSGAQAIANFIEDYPQRMETWYLAGNCIDGESLKILADALVGSDSVTSVWLKRNPLGSEAAEDLFRLITQTPNLRTLDVDQTELGDAGVSKLFNLLATHTTPTNNKLPLRNIYLNGNGLSVSSARAIGAFLQSPHCGLTSLYISSNPLGNEGVAALATALPHAPYLTRLSLQSVGVSTKGVVALCEALGGHPGVRMLDVGQAFATEDLGQAYNYIEDGAVDAMGKMLKSTPNLEYFNLGHCPISPPKVRELGAAVIQTPSLLYYNAISILPDPASKGETFIPSRDQSIREPGQRSKPQVHTDKAIREHLEAHIRAKYGDETTYPSFMEEEKRWLVNDKDVRRIDSVYRNRDMGLARRGVMRLVKDWEEGDETLERVKGAVGPACEMRRK